jgi:hypothetical protein
VELAWDLTYSADLVSAKDIIDALGALLPDETQAVVNQPAAATLSSEASAAPVPDSNWVPLAYLADDRVRTTGLRPLAMRCPDSWEEKVETWRDVAVVVIVRSRLLDMVPVPLRAGPRAGRYFINHERLHADGREMKGPREVQWNGRVYYAEMHYSAYDLMLAVRWALSQAGLDPSGIELQVGGQ